MSKEEKEVRATAQVEQKRRGNGMNRGIDGGKARTSSMARLMAVEAMIMPITHSHTTSNGDIFSGESAAQA